MIYVECKPDYILIRNLQIPKHKIIHAGNKSKVCKRLMKTNNSIGIIDEDPGSIQPSYIKQLIQIYNNQGIKKLYDKNRGNIIILLCPRLEEWIIKAAKNAGINLNKYNLPDNGYLLHKIVNININKFEKLVKELIERKSEMIKTLENTIKQNHFYK